MTSGAHSAENLSIKPDVPCVNICSPIKHQRSLVTPLLSHVVCLLSGSHVATPHRIGIAQEGTGIGHGDQGLAILREKRSSRSSGLERVNKLSTFHKAPELGWIPVWSLLCSS